MRATIDPVAAAGRSDRAVARRRARHARKRSIPPAVPISGCIVAYLLLSFLADPSVWLHGPTTHLYNAGNGDVSEGVWLLVQTPYAIAHGLNPFANDWLHYPSGVNLVDNAGMQLLGLLVAPVTLLSSPVLSYNLLLLLSFAGSATATFLVLRRWTGWLPAAFVGGLAYGFSPYMVAMGNGHLMTLVTPIPPLVLWTMDRIMVRRSGIAWRNGLLLGLLLAAQLFVSVEVLTSTLVVLAVGVVVVLVAQRSDHRTALAWRPLWQAGAVAGAVLAVAVAYPLWVAVAGPAHIVGPAQSVEVLKGLSTDVLTPIVPTVNQHFTFGLAWTGTRLVAEHGKTLLPDGSENGGYLGIPLLVLLVAGVAVLRRRPVVRFAAVMAVVALVLSMGSDLHSDGRFLGIPLPFAVLAHLPFVDSQVASRYTLYVWLFVALLVAVIADALHTELRSRSWSGPLAGGAVLAIVLVVLVPLIPSWPYGSGPTGIPAWYQSAYARQVPVGSTLLSYPFPAVGSPTAMLWQAEAGMRFRMPGGYVISPGPRRKATFAPPLTAASIPLLECGAGIPQPPVTPAAVTAVRANLRAWDVDTVVVPRSQKGWQCATTFYTGVLGPPATQAGSDVWPSLWSRPWMKGR